MKTLWILFTLIGFTFTEKLDRTYLPPPGSKFSGGSPGDIDVPLELPKETNPASSQDAHFRRPEIAIGINRSGPNISPEKNEDIASITSSLHDNPYSFPTTTTSYAFSQTTSYLPVAGSTIIEPEILINSKYPFNDSFNNHDPGYFTEKNPSFDHIKTNNAYKAVEDKEMLNSVNNVLKNQLPFKRINSQVVKKLNDESLHPYNEIISNITEIISYSGDLSIPGITSSPTEINHSLLNNNYDTYRVPSPSETIDQQYMNFISSTPIPTDNVYSKMQSQYVPTSTNITKTPYSYPMPPERILAQKDREAVILNYDNTISPDGYTYSFDTSNGIHADEKGTAINGLRAMGSYSYMGDDGKLYSVNYTADENGFRPYGAHLPTAPPIPDAILKVIEQATKDKDNGIYDDGSYDENKYGYKKYIQNNKDENIINVNKRISNQQPHYNGLGENLHKDDGTNKENKQNFTIKNKLSPFTKTELFNESVSDISPSYKPEHLDHIGKDHMGSSNNDNSYKLQDKVLNSIPQLKDIRKKDKIMSIELYDETGYHYSKPQTDYTLKFADNLLNRFSETPGSNKITPTYNQIVEDIPVRPFMTPYVSRNDDVFVDHEGDDPSIDIPGKYDKEENVIPSHQNTKLFPTLEENRIIPGKKENGIIHNFINQFKQPNISYSDDKGYYYSKKANFNNNSYIPFTISADIGSTDIASTVPSLPSRLDIKETQKDNNSTNPSKHSTNQSSLIYSEAALPNRLLDQEKYHEALNKLDKYNDDITDARSYNVPDIYGGDKDYTIEHSTSKIYNGEDFSGPKQAQKYDPYTGYHY